MLFLIAALRAIAEMLLLCLVAQGFLYLLAGQKRATNPIYELFSLLTRPPRTLMACLLPRHASARTVAIICFLILFLLWFGLALIRKFI